MEVSPEHIGITQFPTDTSIGATRLAGAAEERGFESLWVPESLKIGTASCLVPEHHPIALAKRTASPDSLSGGRFLFGVGAGWNAE